MFLLNVNGPRLVCEDITGGQEGIPIPATNLVDDPPVAPTGKWNNKVGLNSFSCFDQYVRTGLDILVVDWSCAKVDSCASSLPRLERRTTYWLGPFFFPSLFAHRFFGLFVVVFAHKIHFHADIIVLFLHT